MSTKVADVTKEFMRKLRVVLFLLWCKLSWFITSDSFYLKVYFWLRMGERLDLKNPKTFNQKIQWLKLHTAEPRFTGLVDKYGVREYIRQKIGEEYLVPLLGVWDRFEDIDFECLPERFVLKTTHDSGSYIICSDKSAFNIVKAGKKLKKALRTNYFYKGREHPYKEVKPRIIAEPYLVDESGTELKDYKFYCSYGKPVAFFIASNREVDLRYDCYDMNFNQMDYTTNKHGFARELLVRNEVFNTMISLCEKLSEGIPFVRLDFYNVLGKAYFGEFTFYCGGGVNDISKEWDTKWGNLITLPDERIHKPSN